MVISPLVGGALIAGLGIARGVKVGLATTLALFVGCTEVARSVGRGDGTMMRVLIERYAGTGRYSQGRRTLGIR